ncbi:MAG: LysR family transcriptional regulator [Candidatus Scatomorpha sp.]|jgi:DNA-binding transcriptional LysR family regulator
MELKYLKTFRTIIGAGSFQRAAEILNYSQSTVTFQMQQLEQGLNVKLFEKIGRKMMPTSVAQELLPHIDAVLEQIAFIECYGKNMDEQTGKLTVSMPETLLTYKSQEALRRFREEAPNVRVSLQTKNCYLIRDQIIDGQIDFGIHYDVGGYDSNVRVEKLAEFELSLVCSRSLQDRDFISKHQRKKLCLLTDSKSSIFYTLFSRCLSERDIVVDDVLELGSIEAIKRSVMSNMGVAMLPNFTVCQEVQNGQLDVIDTKMDNDRITAVCAYHKNKWLTPSMVRFIDLIKATI